MQIRPYFKCHGHQSFRRALSSSSIRQIVNLVDETDEKNMVSKTFPANMHIWVPYGLFLGKPIWDLCGQAHVGLPIRVPDGSHITAPLGKTNIYLFKKHLP